MYVALAGELLPFALGFAFGAVSAPVLFPHGNAFAYSLFCGTALAITALPILGRIMLELDLHRSAVGVIAISAAAIDDVVGWLSARGGVGARRRAFLARGIRAQAGTARGVRRRYACWW